MLKLTHEAYKTPGARRPNPGIIGDPAWGNPLCLVCDGYFHPDQDMVRVRRFGWGRAFVHGHHPIGEVARVR